MPQSTNNLLTPWRIGVLAVVAISFTHCSLDNHATREDGYQVLEFQPTLITASKDATTEGKILHFVDLFERAYAKFEEAKYQEALKDYNKIIEFGQDTPYYLPSLYNAGLSYEHLGQPTEAASCYRKIISSTTLSPDTKDAYFRLAAVDEKLAHWDEILTSMQDVSQLSTLDSVDRIEAHVRMGWAYLQLKQLEEAESQFMQAISLNNKAPAAEQLSDNSPPITQSHYGIGNVYHRRLTGQPLILPSERMQRDLETKAQNLLAAQSSYLRALASHDPTWSLAAGVMIARLYEDFYKDILFAEIPSGLSKEELSLYFHEVREKIAPLVRRAKRIYQKALAFSERLGRSEHSDKWIRLANESMAHLEKYTQDPTTQRRLERFVTQRRPLSNLFDPQAIVEDAVQVAVNSITSD